MDEVDEDTIGDEKDAKGQQCVAKQFEHGDVKVEGYTDQVRE